MVHSIPDRDDGVMALSPADVRDAFPDARGYVAACTAGIPRTCSGSFSALIAPHSE